jgi:hypothetical protein
MIQTDYAMWFKTSAITQIRMNRDLKRKAEERKQEIMLDENHVDNQHCGAKRRMNGKQFWYKLLQKIEDSP